MDGDTGRLSGAGTKALRSVRTLIATEHEGCAFSPRTGPDVRPWYARTAIKRREQVHPRGALPPMVAPCVTPDDAPGHGQPAAHAPRCPLPQVRSSAQAGRERLQ